VVSFLARLLRAKLTIWVLLALPFVWAALPVLRPTPVDPDPLKTALLHFGLVASILLATVLTFSPLRILFPRFEPALALNRHRRLVGVAAFVFALVHLAAHTRHVYDGSFDTFFKELQKPFQLTGLVAFAILFVLTITSVHAAVRRLGPRRWKNLHRLAYLAAALVVYHQAEARKLFPWQVVWIFGPPFALQLARWWKIRRPAAA
jgi:sulfoxide reductase heme-binding subunit YedZ